MPPPSTDFALIGHQDSWTRLERLVRTLRAPDRQPLDSTELREIVPWIPPRVVVRLLFPSLIPERSARGVYIESFITPDELSAGNRARLLGKTRDAIQRARREGARIASLGGFTSIILEGSMVRPEHAAPVVLTTGNTLAVAYIVKGVERAAKLLGRDLAQCGLLIIGASGDVGIGCVRYLARRVGTLLLAARNVARLRAIGDEVRNAGVAVRLDVDVGALLGSADIVIGAAAVVAPTFHLAGCRPGVLVCDAGYPANLIVPDGADIHLFRGGMGQAIAEWRVDGAGDSFYAYPAPFVAHGCMLEGVALALEGRIEPFSAGRGNITESRIDEIWAIAERHGLALAPFFNADGLWELPEASVHPGAVAGA